MIQKTGFRSPSGIGLGSQDLQVLPAHDILFLFGDRRRVLASMSEPLVPLGRDLYLAVVHRAGVFDNAPHAVFMRVEGIAEFPIGVSFEVEALEINVLA
jgi:hypothetical protein